MKLAVVSCSLNPGSRSRILARAAREALREQHGSDGVEIDFIDLAELPGIPFCDGGAAYGIESSIELKNRLVPAAGILMATPVYNYSISSSAKNVIELTGRDVWTDKVAGFMCAAGGHSSYMSIMGLANSLMLDFRTLIIPRFVYATGGDFNEERTAITNEDVAARIHHLAADLVHLAEALP